MCSSCNQIRLDVVLGVCKRCRTANRGRCRFHVEPFLASWLVVHRVIDELDALTTSQDIDYQLWRWARLLSSRLIVIAIANSSSSLSLTCCRSLCKDGPARCIPVMIAIANQSGSAVAPSVKMGDISLLSRRAPTWSGSRADRTHYFYMPSLTQLRWACSLVSRLIVVVIASSSISLSYDHFWDPESSWVFNLSNGGAAKVFSWFDCIIFINASRILNILAYGLINR